MAFTDFSEFQYEKTVDTGEKIFMGGFSTQENDELSNMRVKIAVQGVNSLVGNEAIQLKIYSDAQLQNVLYTSSESKLTDISTVDSTWGTTEYWIGWLRIDFAKENINKNINYFLGGEINNYTRTGSLICGFLYDFPDSSYDNGEALFFDHPIAFQINGFRS